LSARGLGLPAGVQRLLLFGTRPRGILHEDLAGLPGGLDRALGVAAGGLLADLADLVLGPVGEPGVGGGLLLAGLDVLPRLPRGGAAVLLDPLVLGGGLLGGRGLVRLVVVVIATAGDDETQREQCYEQDRQALGHAVALQFR
jgi:hypothetical protein